MIVVGEGQGKGERIDEDRKMEGKEMTLLQGTWMVIVRRCYAYVL